MKKNSEPLSKTHPEIAKEADGWDPSKFSFGDGTKVQWKCKNNHSWVARINSRTTPLQMRNCPYCSGKKVQPDFNDLSTTHPEIAKFVYNSDPTKVSKGSRKKIQWQCELGHIWSAVPNTIIRGRWCPVCSGSKVLAGFNDLATTHPELSKEADGWDPKTSSKGSEKKVGWKCINNHFWLSTISSRTNMNSGCPVCSGSKVLAGFNDLATTHPELSKEADGWDPKTSSKGSIRKLSWKCELGHQYLMSPNSKTNGKYGCPICSNHRLLQGFNDLATTHPEIANQADGWDPKTILKGSRKKVSWICELGHSYSSSVGQRSVKNQGCPICSGRKVLIGFNDLKTRNDAVANEAFGWDPTTVTVGSNKKMNWKCQFGHTWKTTVNDRIGGGKSCPTCANAGFDPNEKGYLYFLIQPKWELYQIGISNNPHKRIKSHNKNGFELLDLRGPMDGHIAQELETVLLRYLKSQKADLSPEHVAGKFDGYSESWTIDSFKVNNLKELIDKANEVR